MNVTIIGGSGYTGGELIKILHKHPRIEEISITSRRHRGKRVSDLHPNLDMDLKFEKLDIKKANKSDFVFCCVPHTKAMVIMPKIRTKVIDLSADFRLKDPKMYREFYGIKHRCPSLLKEAVYGLPEFHRKEIKKARLIANPGCFPTGAILGCYPFVKKFKSERIVIDAKTGVSGAGRATGDRTHFPSVNENVVPYNVTKHRHLPEMWQELGVRVGFTPHLVPITRGILTTVHIFTKADKKKVLGAYKKFYRKEPFIRVMEGVPSLLGVKGSNYCHIGGIESDGNRIVIFSAIDNLVKGASGQAVQNMNLMAGFDETLGLESIGGYP